MKKLNLLFIILALGISTLAKAAEMPDYVITAEGVKYFEKVRYGLTNYLTGVIKTAANVQYSADEIIAYRKNGKVYERMPVIESNRETGRYAFMEVLSYRSGLKVYRHSFPSGHDPREDNMDYLVYRDGKYVVRFDERNAETLKRFFFTDFTLAAN
jgi:hypothetical protein